MRCRELVFATVLVALIATSVTGQVVPHEPKVVYRGGAYWWWTGFFAFIAGILVRHYGPRVYYWIANRLDRWHLARADQITGE